MKQKSVTDKVFDEEITKVSDFKFSSKVASVFDDMVSRSVPFYGEIQRMIAEIAADHAQKGTDVYDLGCSTGTTMIGMNTAVDNDIRFIGMDDSREMLKKCDSKLKKAGFSRAYELRNADLHEGPEISNASVVVLCLTLLFIALFIPLFLFIYQAIVLAEENFLRGKFGETFDQYCKRVNRWIPNLKGIGATFKSMQFSFNRWILKEYNTQLVWLLGITLILLFYYPQLTYYDAQLRNNLLLIIIPLLLIAYLTVRYLKKSGRMVE